MNDSVWDGDELVAMLDEIMFSLIEALQSNDWVEAGRLDAAIHAIALALEVKDYSRPTFSTGEIWYVPLLPSPSTI